MKEYVRVWNRLSSPWNKPSPPPKIFHINQGIVVIFQFFFLQTFSKNNKRTPMFIPDSRVRQFHSFDFNHGTLQPDFQIPKQALIRTLVLLHFCTSVEN